MMKIAMFGDYKSKILIVLCLILMQQTIVASDDVQEMRKQHKLSLQQQEQMLLQMQHEIQVQLQSLYAEQHRLDSPDGDGNDIGYEYPSYCANCLGDTFEATTKNLLSSEYSRKLDGNNRATQSESELNQLSDHKRLEAIKQQILLKLNLREKPNITNSVPKQFILDTLHRASERDFEHTTMMMQTSSMRGFNDESIVERLQKLRRNNSDDHADEKDYVEDESDFDDFYGKTREIITFAERGQRINSHHILSFSTTYDSQTQPNAKLKIRKAILSIMISSPSSSPTTKKIKREFVQKHYDRQKEKSRSNVNITNDNFNRLNQAQTSKRRKRRKKDGSFVNDKNLYFNYDNDNFNSHISNNNDNENNKNRYNSDYHYNVIDEVISNNNHNNNNNNNNNIKNNNNNDNHIIKSNSYDNFESHGGQQTLKQGASFRDSLSSSKNKFGNFTQISTNIDNHYRHKHKSHNNITLWIFRVHDANQSNPNSSVVDENKILSDRLEYSTSQEIVQTKLGWHKIDVTSLIQKFFDDTNRSNSDPSLKLLVDCSGCIRSNHKIHLLQDTDESTKPFLVVHMEPNIMRRTRRRAIDCSMAGKSQCCKQRFYVSFKTLGWDDWIIAPPGYYANYCRGDCGNGIHRTPDTLLTYYSHVIHEVRKYNKLNGNQLCCAPLKFSSMSLIYFDPDGKIIKRDLPKMVVDECGCP